MNYLNQKLLTARAHPPSILTKRGKEKCVYLRSDYLINLSVLMVINENIYFNMKRDD